MWTKPGLGMRVKKRPEQGRFEVPFWGFMFFLLGIFSLAGLNLTHKEEASRSEQEKLLEEIRNSPDPSELMVKVARLASPWVVNISSVQEREGIFSSQISESIGTGLIMTPDGHVLTNCHVISKLSGMGSTPKQQVFVTLSNGEKFKARVMGMDFLTDLGVLKIQAHSLIPARLGDSSKVQVGEWVIAVGNAFHFGGSVSHGIVSACRDTSEFDFRVVDIFEGGDCQYIEENLIQTDAPINPGNSGGPLVSMRGEVIGINTFIISKSGSSHGVGFAIPVNLAKIVFDEICRKGKVTYGYFGAEVADLMELSTLDRSSLHIEAQSGVLVTMIQPEGPAFRAGLSVEDVVEGINGEAIKSKREFAIKEARQQPGEWVVLQVKRGKESLSVKVKVGTRPDPSAFQGTAGK